jgi:Protein of unknown function (DUF2855)
MLQCVASITADTPMSLDAGQRLFIQRSKLPQTHVGPDPDAPASRALRAGEARFAIEQFALTANNITYAAFGEAMKYWQFFPAPDASLGCLPVWGFATVSESQVEGLHVGRRVYGYWPAGSHCVVQAARVNAAGFTDTAAHRAELAAVYNQYIFCDADPGWRADALSEGLQAVLRPLFITSFLIDDFLADNQFFGAKQVLLSSASSKTAYGTAFCLSQRQGKGNAGMPALVGLTSAGNLDFARTLGCYSEVRRYDEVGSLDPTVPTVYVDFAGNAAVRRAVHERFADALAYSSSIGGTHWEALGSGGGLPGPRPTLFFAPAQIKKRSASPPEGWGREGLQQRLALAWTQFIQRVTASGGDGQAWVRIVSRHGADAVRNGYGALLAGQADAREGLMLSLHT